MSTVNDLVKPPITIKKSANCYDAIRALLDKKISRLLVEDEEGITGIVTQKDIGLFLLNDTTDRTLEHIPLKEIIKPIKSIPKSSSVNECAQFMLENQFGSIGISDGTKIIGVITKTDLTRFFQETFPQRKIVGEYMSPYYAWAYDDTPLYKIVKKMIDEKISRVILRDHNERPVGILSFRDLFRTVLLLGQEKDVLDNEDPAISVVFARKGFLSETGFGGTTSARDIMKSEIITVNYDDDLAKACSVLNENRVHGVGVLSKNGSLIGVLSKTDIIKALAFID